MALTPREIFFKVCRHYDIDCDLVLSRSREPRVVACRHRVAFEMRKIGMSYPEIGKFLGRNHTTILVALRKHPNKEIEEKVEEENFNREFDARATKFRIEHQNQEHEPPVVVGEVGIHSPSNGEGLGEVGG